MDEGNTLSDGDAVTCEFPEKFLTDSFIVVDDDEPSSAIPFGQKLIAPLKRGDPVLYSHFESRRVFALSDVVPQKTRAISIRVNAETAVGQLVRPNDHVDVIGVFRAEKSQEFVARTVLQNVVVIATGKTTGTTLHVAKEDERYASVSLLVFPEEAELLALAAATGTLTLSLRSPYDTGVRQETKEVTQKMLRAGEKAAVRSEQPGTR